MRCSWNNDNHINNPTKQVIIWLINHYYESNEIIQVNWISPYSESFHHGILPNGLQSPYTFHAHNTHIQHISKNLLDNPCQNRDDLHEPASDQPRIGSIPSSVLTTPPKSRLDWGWRKNGFTGLLWTGFRVNRGGHIRYLLNREVQRRTNTAIVADITHAGIRRGIYR